MCVSWTLVVAVIHRSLKLPLRSQLIYFLRNLCKQLHHLLLNEWICLWLTRVKYYFWQFQYNDCLDYRTEFSCICITQGRYSKKYPVAMYNEVSLFFGFCLKRKSIFQFQELTAQSHSFQKIVTRYPLPLTLCINHSKVSILIF